MSGKKNKVLPKPQDTLKIYEQGQSPDMVNMKDAFVALSLSLMREMFLSSDTKYFIFLGMKHNLEEMGYDAKSIKTFLEAVDKARANHTTVNNFMG